MLTSQGSRPGRPQPLYTANYSEAYRLSSDRVLVRNGQNGEFVEVDLAVATVLGRCHGLATLESHCDSARTAFNQTNETLEAVLRSLTAAGLLAPLPPVPVTRGHNTIRSRPLTTVGIVTSDRPTLLRRCLDSVLDSARQRVQPIRVLIVDGSRTEARTINRNLALDAARRYHGSVEYLGRREAAALRRSLARVTGTGRELAYGLTPGTIGANRNLLMMATAGENVLMIDDDVMCRGWQSSDARPDSVTFGGHEDLRSSQFYRDRHAALTDQEGVSVNVLDEHASVLGSTFQGLCASGRPVDLGPACHHIAALAVRGQQARIRVTFSGLAGDAGVFCPYMHLFSSGPTRQRLMSDEDALENALTYREVRKTANTIFVTHDPGCMSYCMGLFNHDTCPPFMALGRNEDGVFGSMLAYVFPNDLFAHLPHAVCHDSNRPSAYSLTGIPSASVTRVCDVMFAVVRHASHSAVATRPSARIGLLVSTMRDLGHLDDRSFTDWFRKSVLSSFSHLLDRAASQDASPLWSAALERYRQELTLSLRGTDFFVPLEFQGRSSRDASPRRVKALLRTHARLLEGWGELLGAAQRDRPWLDCFLSRSRRR